MPGLVSTSVKALRTSLPSQAPTEQDHFESKATLTCILEDLAACYTTEWEFYVPAGEYLKMITPHSGDTDLCPRDLDHGWSLAANMSRGLIRFRTDLSECESEFAACLFANFLQLKASFDRFVSKETEARVAEANLTRGKHMSKEGDIVYRRPQVRVIRRFTHWRRGGLDRSELGV